MSISFHFSGMNDQESVLGCMVKYMFSVLRAHQETQEGADMGIYVYV